MGHPEKINILVFKSSSDSSASFESKQEGGDVERLDSISKDGAWAPPRKKELYFHSHLSEEPGVLDSDGLDDVFDPSNIQFVERVSGYLKGRDLTEISSGNRELVELLANGFRRLVDESRGGDDSLGK